MLKKTSTIVSTCVLSFGIPLAAAAQPSRTAKPQDKTATHSAAPATTVHLEGCVFPMRAMAATRRVVPLLTPEDYVLTNTKVIAAAAGVEVPPDRIFKLEEVAQERLRELNGERVGVTGRIEEKPDMPQLQVTSIRMITGECPVVPSRHS